MTSNHAMSTNKNVKHNLNATRKRRNKKVKLLKSGVLSIRRNGLPLTFGSRSASASMDSALARIETPAAL
jgi:hypothetical protein